ncbi:MAG: beta-ketoacyl synthase N-terminal-like domain-containing protein, partial [Sneathiella sp.]
MNRRRIVVTGLGVVSPLGVGADLSWQRLIEGRSGIRLLQDSLVSDVKCKVGGVVPSRDEDPEGGY